MKTCPKCGSAITEDDNFCGQCGLNLSVTIQTTTVFMQKDLNANDMRYKLGEVYLKQGKYDLAIKNFKQVLSENPDNPAANEMLQQAVSAQNKVTE